MRFEYIYIYIYVLIIYLQGVHVMLHGSKEDKG